MLFWKWKKKNIKCNHHWHLLDTSRQFLCEWPMDGDFHDFAHIYCPKCDSRKMVLATEWARIEKAQEIKLSYQSIKGDA